jgi:hypothetical protein
MECLWKTFRGRLSICHDFQGVNGRQRGNKAWLALCEARRRASQGSRVVSCWGSVHSSRRGGASSRTPFGSLATRRPASGSGNGARAVVLHAHVERDRMPSPPAAAPGVCSTCRSARVCDQCLSSSGQSRHRIAHRIGPGVAWAPVGPEAGAIVPHRFQSRHARDGAWQ